MFLLLHFSLLLSLSLFICDTISVSSNLCLFNVISIPCIFLSLSLSSISLPHFFFLSLPHGPSFYCTKSLICSSSEATHMATDKNQIRVIIPPEGSTPSLWGSYTTKPSTYVEKKFDGAQLVNVRWAFCTSQICNSQWSSVWRDFAIIF